MWVWSQFKASKLVTPVMGLWFWGANQPLCFFVPNVGPYPLKATSGKQHSIFWWKRLDFNVCIGENCWCLVHFFGQAKQQSGDWPNSVQEPGYPRNVSWWGRRSPILLLCSVQKPRTGLLHHIQTLEENTLLKDENASLLGRLLCSFGHGLKTVSKSKLEVKAPELFGSMVQQFLPPFSWFSRKSYPTFSPTSPFKDHGERLIDLEVPHFKWNDPWNSAWIACKSA